MDRLRMILRDGMYNEFIAKNESCERERIYCRHTFQHMLDVARITYTLMLEAGDFSGWIQQIGVASSSVGKELIYTASMLHDIGRWEQYETGVSHAITSARYAAVLMTKAGFMSWEINVVVEAIQEHRSSSAPHTVLGKYLQKADRLSRLCFSCYAGSTCKDFSSMDTIEGIVY